MKKTLKFLAATASIALALVILMSFINFQPKPWEVPANYKTMKNPVKSTPESIASGKALYNQHCASCHGKKGLGDGPKARTLDTPSGDMSGTAYQGQTDGEHFYKTKFGRGDMPKYDKKYLMKICGVW
ncbi:MAG: c-type cytochrome [Bacteroidales bacterium]|nr:c-type cytochrome [Bacteroidales bacterium]